MIAESMAENYAKRLDKATTRNEWGDITMESGQAKTLWRRVLQILLEEYSRRFHEKYVQDE